LLLDFMSFPVIAEDEACGVGDRRYVCGLAS